MLRCAARYRRRTDAIQAIVVPSKRRIDVSNHLRFHRNAEISRATLTKCNFSTSAPQEQPTVVLLTKTDPRILSYVLILHKNVEFVPTDEMEFLANALLEHYGLRPGSITVTSPLVRRQSMREWHIDLSFDTNEALNILNYIVNESTQQGITMLTSIIERVLAPFALHARVRLNRTIVEVPPEPKNVEEQDPGDRVESLKQKMIEFNRKRKYRDTILLYQSLRAQFGLRPTPPVAAVYLEACYRTGRQILAEAEFRYWVRVLERAANKNAPEREALIRAKYRGNDELIRLTIAYESKPKFPSKMLDAMESMYIHRKMLPQALRIFELRHFKSPSSYNKLISLCAFLSDGDTAMSLLNRFFAWRLRARMLAKLRNRTVVGLRPMGKTVGSAMLALCRSGRVRDAAQLLVDQEARAQAHISRQPQLSPESISRTYLSDSCYGILLYYLDAPERSDEFIERMSTLSLRPTASYFAWLLKTYRKNADIEESTVISIVQALADWSASPTATFFGQLFSFYAEKNRPAKVLALFREMASTKMIITNANVLLPVLEFADEALALEIFDFLVAGKKLAPNPAIQLKMINALIRSAEAKLTAGKPSNAYLRCLNFVKMMSIWRDRWGTQMSEEIVLALLQSLQTNKLLQEIDILFSIAVTATIPPTAAFRAALIRATASCNALDQGLRYWNELERDHGLLPDVTSLQALIEAAAGTKYVPKAVNIVLYHRFYDWHAAASVYLTLLKQIVEPSLDVSESKWADLCSFWSSVCLNDSESLESGTEKLKKLFELAWPQVQAKLPQ